MKLRAIYKGYSWDVKTLFLQERGSTGARLERTDESGALLVEFPSRGEFKLLRDTGVVDKNGTSIFEGDLVRFTFFGAVVHETVAWDSEQTGFFPFARPPVGADTYINPRCVEIVGNTPLNTITANGASGN